MTNAQAADTTPFFRLLNGLSTKGVCILNMHQTRCIFTCTSTLYLYQSLDYMYDNFCCIMVKFCLTTFSPIPHPQHLSITHLRASFSESTRRAQTPSPKPYTKDLRPHVVGIVGQRAGAPSMAGSGIWNLIERERELSGPAGMQEEPARASRSHGSAGRPPRTCS